MQPHRQAILAKGSFLPSFLMLALLQTGLGLGCDAENEDSAFEQWRSEHVIERENGRFLVEGDILMSSEEDLRSYFYASFPQHRPENSQQLRAIVGYVGDAPNGYDNRFPRTEQLNLTYCVSDDFLGSKSRVVSAMRRKTLDWERTAAVNFVYRSGSDANCGNSSTGPRIQVVAVTSDEILDATAAAFFPEPPPMVDPQKLFITTDIALVLSDPELDRVVLHELGHILGLRHEHIHDSCTDEVSAIPASDQDARDLTLNDLSSIMYYGTTSAFPCPRAAGANDVLSRLDVIGVKNLYNDPRSWWSGSAQNGDHRTDYDGDGRADILFARDQNGPGLEPEVWHGQANGTFDKYPTTYSTPSYAASTRHRMLPGYFKGNDDTTDIFMYGQANVAEVLIEGEATRGSFSIGPNPTVFNAYQPLVGDFVGGSASTADRYTDIVWYRPGTNPDAFWQGDSSGTFVNLSANINGYYHPLVANFNCDGWSDIIWYNPLSNSSPVWYGGQTGFSTNSTVTTIGGTSGLTSGAPYYPIVGDFDDANGADIFWYRPGSDSDQLWLSDCSSPDATKVSLSISGDYKPFTGDFDGDGSADIFWYGPGNGFDTLWLGGGSGSNPFTPEPSVNMTGDHPPVVADFDGDGDSDILWYKPWNNTSRRWLSNGDGTFSGANVTNPSYVGFPVGYVTAY